MRLEIPEDCCEIARQLIANGIDPNEQLEFYRDVVLCLRGTAKAFASRRVKINNSGTPVHVRYKAPPRRVTAPPVR